MLSPYFLQPFKHRTGVLARHGDDRVGDGRRSRALDACRDDGRALLERTGDGLVVPKIGSLVLDRRVDDVEGFVAREARVRRDEALDRRFLLEPAAKTPVEVLATLGPLEGFADGALGLHPVWSAAKGRLGSAAITKAENEGKKKLTREGPQTGGQFAGTAA